jgi:type VI protein secretion system component Hcp
LTFTCRSKESRASRPTTPTGDGRRVKYYEVELENMLVGYVAPSVAPGSGMSENVNLKFSRV